VSPRPGRNYSQAARLHDVIRTIEARRGITLDELAQESGVTLRTVHRDLAAIEDAGYPLISEWQGNRKLFSFITGFKDVPPISFTLPELMTLSLFRSQLEFLKGTPFHDDMAAIARKVASVLPPRYAAHMERMAEVTVPLLDGSRDYGRVARQLTQLREALLFQYVVTLSYAPRGRSAGDSYEVEPYTLIVYKGGLYLLGYARNRKGLRTFAVERITGVTVEMERFQIPEEFNPEEQLRQAFGIVAEPVMNVVVRFSPVVAESVRERSWHRSQKISEQSDGGIIVSFTAGGRMEIMAWILSFGLHAEVLEPAELREEVGRNVAAMARAYGNHDAGRD
jgi:predicted DNA-binding transcriptional regulator YafY